MRLWLLLVVSFPGLAQAPLYRIGGVVVHSVTAAPLPRTRITVTDEADTKKTAFVVTSADGRFAFDVPEGRYQLSAERHGQDRQRYGQATLWDRYSVAVIAGPDRRTDRITFRMIPNSSLSGRVADEASEPVESALVQLFRASVVSGRRKVDLYRWVYSDDTGHFRFSRLPAGNYFVAASGQPWYATQGKSDAARITSMSFPLTFYPNTRDWRSASIVSLKAGDDATVDLSLAATPGYALTVQCSAAGASSEVDIVTEAFGGAESFAKVEDMACPHAFLGRFPPGTYLLRSSRNSRADGKKWTARQKFEISSSDVEIQMDFKPAPSLSGKIQATDLKPDQLVLSLRAETGGATMTRGVSADGSFTFPQVVAGTYRLLVTQPEGVWVKQTLADGKTLAGGAIGIAEDPLPQLTVIAERGLAHVTGRVLKNGTPVAAVSVVLVPKTPSDDPSDYGTDRSNSDGSFEMKFVRPGDYYLFAAATQNCQNAARRSQRRL